MNNNFNGVVGDHLMIAHYVRYERLAELINAEFYNSNYNEINLCIDAYSMIKSIYGLQPYQFIDELSISSCIINACAHYRNFFWTRYNVTCKIYIVFSRMEQSIAEAKMFYPTYENIFTTEPNPSMDALINKNLGVLEELCPYIPDVKFIHSKYEPGLVFGNIATDVSKPTIIVSKDPWVLQVTANLFNAYILRPTKNNGQDISILISHKNVISYYLQMRKTNTCAVLDPTIISPHHLSYMIAAAGFPERKLGKLHLLRTISNLLIEAICKMYITHGIIVDIKSFNTEISNVSNIKLKTFDIECRFNAIGFNPCMLRYMMSPMIDNLDMINLHNPDQMKQINERYFSKVPLDLMAL